MTRYAATLILRLQMAVAEQARVHVTFHQSAAGSLKMALKSLGRDEQVWCLVDDLSYGPISPGDVRQRMQWTVDELGFHEEPLVEELITEFWQRIDGLRTEEVVAWISRRYVTEYCGFMEVLWRLGEACVSVVDVADVEFTRRDGLPSPTTSLAFSVVPDTQIVEKNLFDLARRVSDVERKRYAADWRRLREESGELRVLTDSGVVSVPINYYDSTILSLVTNEWQSCARVVGNTVGKMMEGPYRQCSSDELFFDRLLKLIDDDVIEGKNEQELWSMRESWVRQRDQSMKPG